MDYDTARIRYTCNGGWLLDGRRIFPTREEAEEALSRIEAAVAAEAAWRRNNPEAAAELDLKALARDEQISVRQQYRDEIFWGDRGYAHADGFEIELNPGLGYDQSSITSIEEAEVLIGFLQRWIDFRRQS